LCELQECAKSQNLYSIGRRAKGHHRHPATGTALGIGK
jgi:hypothetical protein